ncbi:phage tail tape measure protein [Clostridium sp. CCUG 7971]|uniref:phage tail tape measure protein n=1 Tax=Clostridium sp. CCUG 7971 TaxID=2811414 RepID=UPI001ABA3CE1|nr:phage tail tape measure protein [Clostridium sp. CCUG 7971]MBO3443415.1 phage tail tape measure protein [Clostridium sp. CCUG 7971]
MAKGIKGITVEIGGDTGPLDKALGDVNKNSRSLQVELRQVEKLLKLDPTNTELLAQKQELLSQSVGTTEEKLNALKAAQVQVKEQFENGDIGEEQYRAFQREIIKTENELSNIKGSLQTATRNLEEFGDNHGVAKDEAEKLSRAVEEQNNALDAEKEALKQAEREQREHADAVRQSTEELEKQKEELLSTAKNIGAGMVAVGSGAITIATYATKLNTDFDKAFNTLITKTGASKDEFDSLNEAMENVYKNNFGESIEDVAQSMATVKVNTNLAGNELELATERALLLRDTFEFDVNESTRTAKMMMEQFGLSSEEAYNLIAQGAQMGLDKNGDLLDTINEYSVHFEQAGYSAEEMLNSLKNGTEAGTFSVDKLGDAVKEFGIRMKDGSDGTSNALKDLGLNVNDVVERFSQGGDVAADAMGEVVDALFTIEDPLKQNEIGVALFGTMFEDLGPKGVEALMYIGGEADRTSNALDDINNKKYDDLGSALAGLGRVLTVDVVEPLGNELKPAIEEVIGYVKSNAPTIKDILASIVKSVGDFVGFVVNNGPLITGAITAITTSFIILKGVLIAEKIFLFVKGLMALEGGLTIATVAAKLFNSTWLANPFVLVGALIAGVVVGIMTLWNTSEEFRNVIIGIWESIKQSAEVCWGAVCTFFTETIPQAWQSVCDFFSGIPEWFNNLWTSVTDTFTQWGDNITNFFTSTIPQWIEDIGNWFNELPNKIGYAIGEALANIVNWGVDTWNYFSTNIPIWIEGVSTWFSELPDKIWSWLSNAIQKVVDWGTQTYNKAKEYISNTINSVIKYFSELPDKIWTWLSNSINKIIQWGSDMASKAKQAVDETVKKIINGFKNLPDKIKKIGSDIVEGIWNGITGAGDWLWGKISGFCSNIVKGFKDNLKINSPSKIMRDIIGSGIVEGIAVGMIKNEDQVKSATARLSKLITSEIEKIQSNSDKDLNLLNVKINDLKDEEKDRLAKLKYEKEDKLDKIKDANKKKAIQREYDAIENSIKKEYDKKENALKEKIELMKKETKSKIDELKATEKAVEEQLKKELEDRKDFVKQVNDLTKEIVNALKTKYQAEYKAQEESIKKQITNLDKWKEESIKKTNIVYDAKIKAIDDELKALENAQKQKDRDETEKEELENIEKIKNAIEFEHDDSNKAQLEKELEKLLNERKKRLEIQELEDKKEELKSQKEQLEEKKKNEIDNINEIYASEKEMYETRLEESKKFYEQRVDDAKLQAEAEKLIIDKNQKEIVELLNSYAKSYEVAGMTLGDKLVEGFKPAIDSIKSMIAGITSDLNSARENALASRSLSNNLSNSRTINTNHNTNNYEVNVSNSSGGVERAIEKGFRELAFIIP